MGQEASLPQDTTGETGLDPPSSQLPPKTSANGSDRSNSSRNHPRPGKALKQIFQRSGGGGAEASHSRDAARAAAEAGHFDPYPYPQQQQQQQPQPQQQAYYGDVPPPPPPADMSSPPQPYPVVGLMYSADTPNNSSSTRSVGSGGRKVGKALLHSMRNLSIVGSGRPVTAPTGPEDGIYKTTGLPQQQPPATATKGVRDWETRWDEDQDDDDDDDDDVPPPQQQISRAVSGDLLGLTTDESMRPGMDAAHASATPGSPVRVAMPPSQPQLHTASASATVDHERASELIPTGTAKVDQQQLQQQQALREEWEPPVLVPDEESYEKPNVEMFLPMLRVLGKGSFGKVVLVQKRRGLEHGQLYAMKILRKTHLLKRRQIERTRTERKVLSVVGHPFIMKLHYAFQSDDKLYLVLDYCPGGELFFHLSRFRRFPERVARFYAAELLLALGHLHKRGIIYRDLKPENVLLDADGHVKLGDFGLAKSGIRHPYEGAMSMCGTPEYMAPEVLSQAGHGFCVDYWGLGMLVYEMMTGLPPWYTTDRAKLFRRLKSAPLDIPSYFSPHSAECIGGMLERNPRRRLGVNGIKAAMDHPFFRSINWRALYARRVDAPIKPCEGWKPQDMTNPKEKPGQETLEMATANFDNTFTRMPVESDHSQENHHDDEGEHPDELHADTFIGFTYDEQKEQKEDPAPTSARPRSHQRSE